MTTGTPAEYGASYLDEHYPGWASRVELSKLRMDSPCSCILGQLFSVADTNGYKVFTEIHSNEFAARLGFDVPEDVPADLVDETWECLEAEWSQIVATRQTQTTLETIPQEVTVP